MSGAMESGQVRFHADVRRHLYDWQCLFDGIDNERASRRCNRLISDTLDEDAMEEAIRRTRALGSTSDVAVILLMLA